MYESVDLQKTRMKVSNTERPTLVAGTRKSCRCPFSWVAIYHERERRIYIEDTVTPCC